MSTEFVGIELELMGAAGVRRDLEYLDKLLNSLRGRKKFDMGLNEARTQVVAYKAELKKLQNEQAKVEKGSDEWKRYAIAIDEARQKLWNAQQAVREFGQASREAGRTFTQTFNTISSRVAHIGSAMQSFGNAMTQLTSPFRRLTSGIMMGAGFKVMNSFTEGFERGFTRYDTMKKYPKIMAAFGYSAEEAQKSIDALDMSVRGLPTGLGEMVDLAQRFTATTGDIDKGTKLAIAANNAFLASMSTDTQKYQGMMQLQDVLGGKDMNAREWNSLVSSMTPAIVKMGESLGYTKDNMNEFIQTVRDGKMDNQEFINQLIKIGNEGGALEKMAQESKNTWQAFFANVGNAASRMMAGVIQSFDEISQAVTGKDVNQLFAETIIPNIDKTTKSVKKWIQAHPEEITRFFKELSQIKIGELLEGYAKSFISMVSIVERVANAVGKHKGAMSFLGKFLGYGGALGRLMTIGGGLLKGTRHIWAFLGAGGSWLFKGKLGGIFGGIAKIFGSKKAIQTAGETAKTIPTVADTFKSAFSSLEGLIKAAGAITLVSGTGFVAFKSAKSILKDLKEMVDLVNGGGWDNVGYVGAGVITAIGTFTEIFNAIGKALGPEGLLNVAIAGAASLVVSGSIWGDSKLILEALKNVKNTILEFDKIGDAITNMRGLAGISTGAESKLQSSVDAIQRIVKVLSGNGGAPIDRGEVTQGIPFFTSFRTRSLGNISNAIKHMQDIVHELNKLAGLTLADPTQIITDIKTACNQLQGIRAPKNIQKHTEFAAEALKNIRTMAKRFNSLAGMTINNEGFSAFVEQMRTALEDLKSLSQTLELDIKVVLGDGFKSSVDGVVKQINEGKDDIKNAVRKIPSAITKHISVTLTASVNTAQAVDAIENGAKYVESLVPGTTTPTPRGGRIPRANGGMIYRAYGGGVPFRRRGTDTVPAMLTPGEYVHNRRAVSMFGIDFMRKVNNLDMKGAMNELMHRAGHMANVNRGMNVTNNYNNQKVVINNSNAGAGYTFKTASRFVGAF